MKKIRTRYFHYTMRASLGFSILFLGWFLLFGRSLAVSHFDLMSYSVFAVIIAAAGSFLLFSFAPYFRGDKRWYAIPALLTVVFFAGVVMLWQAPIPEAVLG